MKWIALSNQITDLGNLVPVGQVIPEGELSDAALERLASVGLAQQISDEEAAVIPPAKECDECP